MAESKNFEDVDFFDFNEGAVSLNGLALKQIFDLALSKDLNTMLEQALKILITNFQAQAGSLFFHTTLPRSQKIGSMPEAVLKHIDQWENAVAERLETGIWRVLDTNKPAVSIHTYLDQGLILVNTPLLMDTQVTGSLSLVLAADQPFTRSHRITLARLAQGIGQLGFLIIKLSLTQKRYNELELLHQTSQILATTHDVPELLENVIQLTANVLDAATTSVLLVDREREGLVFEVCHGPQRELIHKQRIPLAEGFAGWVVTQGQPLIINDIAADARFSLNVDRRTGFLIRSVAAVPLRLKGVVIGVIEAFNKESDRGFDEADLQLMTSIAAQTAVTLENANLYQSLREERDKVISAQENERHAPARNLHDGTVQQLSAISMNLEYLSKLIERDPQNSLDEIGKIRNLVHQATKDARLVLFELRPIILETEGLIPALERYVVQLNEDGVLQVQADLSPLPFRIGTQVAGTIFSIIQEAVNNVKRHAKASLLKISVSIETNETNETNENGRLLIEIKDNGQGFDVTKTEDGYAGRNSFGLLNMKERAVLIESVLTIDSATSGPTRGTTIRLSAPLKPGTGSLKNLY